MPSKGDAPSVIPVKAVVRCRPLIANEISDGCVSCLEFVNDANQVIVGGNKPFTFDAVFDPNTCQEDVYLEAVKPLTKGVFKGYHATVFAYGQTGSGKTHSMGSACSSSNYRNESTGIIPRVILDLFNGVSARTNHHFEMKVSYLEIYKEEIIDLLCLPTERKPIIVRDTQDGSSSVSGLTEMPVSNVEETLKLMEIGNGRRTVGATAMNMASSRSHAIFTVIVDFYEKDDIHNRIVSKFHLVDLAGSERAKRTRAEGERLQEGIKINKGLLALGNVISALADENSRSGHIKYRDSKLTRMLQSSLGGNSYTVMIACVSPADSNYEETLNTLRYADRVRKIKNKPVVNHDPRAAQIAALKQEIQSLRLQLLENGPSPAMPNAGSRGGGHQRLESLKDENAKLLERLQSSVEHHAEMCEKVIAVEAERDELKDCLLQIVNCAQLISKDHPNLQEEKESPDMECFSSLICLYQLILGKQQLNSEKSGMQNSGDSMEKVTLDTGNFLGDAPAEEVEAAHIIKKADLGKRLQELSKALSMKEELAKKMCFNDNKMTAMCEQYEAKIASLDSDIQNLVKERSSLETALQQAHKTNESQKISEKRRKRLVELTSEIQGLKKEKKEKEKLMRLKDESDRTVVRLNKEIQDMKRARVTLMRQIKDESDKFNAWKKEKTKEVKQLQEKNRKRNFEYIKLERSYDKQKAILRRKTEEAAAANKRLKVALGKQAAAVKKTISGKKVSDGTEHKIKSWLDEEIEVLCSMKEAEHHLSQLLEDRRLLTQELQATYNSPFKRRRTFNADNPPRRLEMKKELELKNAQIKELQDKLADAKEHQQGSNRWSRILTIADAKAALKHLLNLTVRAKTTTLRSEADLRHTQREKETAEELVREIRAQMQEQENKYIMEKTVIENAFQEELSSHLTLMQQRGQEQAKQDTAKADAALFPAAFETPSKPLQAVTPDTLNRCTPIQLNGKSFFQPLSQGGDTQDDMEYDIGEESYIVDEDSGSEYQPTPKLKKKSSPLACGCSKSKVLCGTMRCTCFKRNGHCTSECRCESSLCRNRGSEDGKSSGMDDRSTEDTVLKAHQTTFEIESEKENSPPQFISQTCSKDSSTYTPLYFDSPLGEHDNKKNVGECNLTPKFFHGPT